MFKKINWFKQETHIFESQQKNPWVGLATYDTNDAYRFRGRDKATQDVFSLIDNNLVVTLYGKSGIGKSSLINAGIIPLLSNVGYKVLAVNIREMKASCNNNENVYKRTISYLKTLLHVEIDIVDETSLWKILHSKDCFEGISEFPVVIFDQFEEIFLDTNPEDADMFVKAISKLTDTGFLFEDGQYIHNNKFRVLLSLREDDLYRLEDSIDRYGLSRMKYNRYRLHSFTISEAESIIALGEEYFENYESCKEKIIEISNLLDGGVDAATLSLLCYRAFEKSRNNKDNIIKEELVSKEKDPLFNLYTEEVSSLTRKEQMFIENNLITASGRRDIVSTNNFKRHIKNADSLLTNTKKHFSLFRLIDYGDNLELIHDSLARAIYKNKEQRNNELERKISTSITILHYSTPLLILIIGFLIFIYKNYTTTRSVFYPLPSWSLFILLIPILCIIATKIKKLKSLYPFIFICFLMAFNNGLFICINHLLSLINSCVYLPQLYPSGEYRFLRQCFYYAFFLVYSIKLYRSEENKCNKIKKVVYVNILTVICLLLGVGYNPFTVRDVISSKASRPWSYCITRHDFKLGYVDWNGNQVLPCIFDTLVDDSIYYLSKHTRILQLENDQLKEIHNCGNHLYPISYQDGELRCYPMPHLENQKKKLLEYMSKENIWKIIPYKAFRQNNNYAETKLIASIFDESRLRIINTLVSNKSLYSKNLRRDIETLFNIQNDSLYTYLNSLNNSRTIISDETISNIRINLSKCICTLQMLESFSEKETIKDDDIFRAILSLQYFTLYELLDENVEGYNVDSNIGMDFYIANYKLQESSRFNLTRFLQKNKSDVYSAFKSLYILDICIHLKDFTDVLNKTNDNVKNRNFELAKILKEQSNLNAKNNDKIDNIKFHLKNNTEKAKSVLNMPTFAHNADLFDFSKVITPLILCISMNTIPDQSTALTDIANRLIIMGMFRGFDMHSHIEALGNAYEHSTSSVMEELFNNVTTIDSLETKSRIYDSEFQTILDMF